MDKQGIGALNLDENAKIVPITLAELQIVKIKLPFRQLIPFGQDIYFMCRSSYEDTMCNDDDDDDD